MRVIISYKNFAANRNISHIGLGVAALNNSKCLNRAGIITDVWSTMDAADLTRQLKANMDVSHVAISAPWIPTVDLQQMTMEFPRIKFAMNCHSNVGFLQADANGVGLIGAAMEVQRGAANFHVAGNSRRFVDWASVTFGTPFTYLPNLYFLEGAPDHPRPPFHGGLLRVGAFGATRPLKNLMSAAGAALTISRFFGGDLELWINSGRDEGAGCIVRAIEEMFRITRHAQLVKAGWASWHDHRKTVARMNLLINCSYTESFNMVAADGIAEGIPSVVSDAICWAPAYWRAPVDDVLEMAARGAAPAVRPTCSGRWLPGTAGAQRRRVGGMGGVPGPIGRNSRSCASPRAKEQRQTGECRYDWSKQLREDAEPRCCHDCGTPLFCSHVD